MSLDDLKKAWRSQEPPEMEISAEEVARRILETTKQLDRGLFWRDMRESVVALGMAAFFAWMALTFDLTVWPLYAASACCVWVAAFLFVDRRVRRDPPQPGMTVRDEARRALREVEHQIRLLRNLFWWYLLPCDLAVLFVTLGTSLQIGEPSEFFHRHLWPVGAILATMAGLNAWAYVLNQKVVRESLAPVREAFEATLAEMDRVE